MSSSSREYLINTQAVSRFLDSLQEQIFLSKADPAPIDSWEPTPPQLMLLESEAFETLYGGGAGGGKTCGGVCVTKLQSRNALMVRRTYQELEDSIIQEALRWYGDRAFYNSTRHVWREGEQRIRFGYAQRFEDVLQYQSAQFDTLFADEISQWTSEDIYLYLFSRVRTPAPHQRCRVIAGTNPGNEGHGWVMRRWAAWLDPNHPNPAKPGELRYYRRDSQGDDIECSPDHPDALSRTFIPALLEDNPHLDEDYEKRLNILREPYRSQLRRGDWTVSMGDAPGQLIGTSKLDECMAAWTPPDLSRLDALGIDVARGGEDQTALAPRVQDTVGELDITPGKLTPDGPSVAAVVEGYLKGRRPAIGLDVIGVGGSPYDILKGNGYNVDPINGAQKAERRGKPVMDRSGLLRLRNIRAAMYWLLAERIEDGTIFLPPDPKLREELLAVRWKLTASGVLVEEKDEIKKRLGRSPDRADAVAMAVWTSGAPVRVPLSALIGG